MIKIEFFKFMINKIFQIIIIGIFCLTTYKIMISLAGRKTIADIGIKLLADIKFVVSIAFGATTGGLYFREKKSKEKIIRQKSKQIDELERIIDSKKQSSGLTETGCTNRRDL